MLNPRFMLILAQAVLVFGAISLAPASVRLFRRALDGGMDPWHLAWIIPVAVLGGGGKARFVMRRRMRANITRLATATRKMWPWQIYPPQLLAFIASMVTMMYIMKRVFADNALALGVLGGVDLAVAVALVVTSVDYIEAWRPGYPGGKIWQ